MIKPCGRSKSLGPAPKGIHILCIPCGQAITGVDTDPGNRPLPKMAFCCRCGVGVQKSWWAATKAHTYSKQDWKDCIKY